MRIHIYKPKPLKHIEAVISDEEAIANDMDIKDPSDPDKIIIKNTKEIGYAEIKEKEIN